MSGRVFAYQLPHTTASGRAQMSADRSLLEWCAAAPARAAFRLYSWERPTLSLGRAEPYPAGWNTAAIEAAGIDVVRRPTGGDAVLHDGELTFAVAVSLPGPWRLRPRAFAETVADALAGALRAAGLTAERIRSGEGAPARAGTWSCFARPASGEVRVGSFKVAGIASRFTRGAALSHASVPLTSRHRDVALFRKEPERDRSELLRHARSAAEILGRDVEGECLGAGILDSLSRLLGASFAAATFADLGLAEPGRAELGAQEPGDSELLCYRLTP